MSESVAHPSREQLSAYSLGQLPSDEVVAIESHVSECEPCCDTIISLSSDDTFVGLLKEARQLPSDQTLNQGGLTANTSSISKDIPAPLAEHSRYEIVGLIGKGGMGDVYKATHRMMQRTVALKIINREFMRKPEAVDRFHREVKAAAQLSHPNIVAAYDAEQAGDIHFLAMEYVEGTNLHELVRDRGALPIVDACEYIRQAAIGLQKAHEQNMVHRDVKPHNLMLGSDGNVKILDFGLAALAPKVLAPKAGLDADAAEPRSDITAAGSVMGTPDFISPEQADDARQADIRSDIYSLGATLYFMLAGRVPFTDGSIMHKLKSHEQVEPEPLESFRNDIPADIAALVSKMMAKNPDKRFQTPAEVAIALNPFVAPSEQAKALPHHGASSSLVDENSMTGGSAANISERVLAAGHENRGSRTWWWLGWMLIATALVCLGLTAASLETVYDFASLFGGNTSAWAQGISGSLRYLIVGIPALLLGIIVLMVTSVRCWMGESGKQSRLRMRPHPQSARNFYDSLPLTAIAIFFVAAIFAGIVYYIQTGYGTICVEVADNSLAVEISGQTVTMKDGDGKPITIRPGEGTLIVHKDDADFEFETDRFLIRRNAKIAFKVEILKGKIVVRKDGEPFAQAQPPEPAELADVSDPGPQTSINSKASAEEKTTAFLIEAAKGGDLEAVEAALKAGVAPNLPSNPLTNLFTTKQLTALHWAVAQRISDGKTIEPSPEITKRLIEAGADVNAADYLGQTPLEWAAKHGAPEIVKMLIKAGAKVNAKSRYGTVLEAAKNCEVAKLLIEAGANVNAGTTMSPLAKAAKNNDVEIVELLIEKGAKVNDPKNPPIHWAGKPEVVKALLKAGADLNQRNGKGETVLNLPVMYFGPDAESVELLIEAGADVNARSQTDATPLHAAIEQNKAEIAQLLIAAGAALDARDKEGNTPLSLAHRGVAWARRNPNVENKPYEVLEQLLVDAGAKDDGRTKLQRAVAAGDADQVKKLIATQVDVNEKGLQNITAMHLASEDGNQEMLAMLIEAGAQPNQADSQGLRPLHLAANAETARMLIAANAEINTGMPSPLYMATTTGKSDVVRELVQHKANITDSDCAGILNWAVFNGQIEVIKVLFNQRDAKALLKGGNPYSPLHVATSGTLGDISSPNNVTPPQRLEIARFLIEKGADVNARWGTLINSQSGAAHMIDTTPLMFASFKGEAAMVKLLLEKGGKVNATNAVGQTPLHFAAQSGHAQVVDLLLKAKADINDLTKETKTPLDLTQDATVKILLLKNGGKTATDVLKDSQR